VERGGVDALPVIGATNASPDWNIDDSELDSPEYWGDPELFNE
jgi:hypothetical protein